MEWSLDVNFAALPVGCKVEMARAVTSTKEVSCSYIHSAIVFSDHENSRIAILGFSRSSNGCDFVSHLLFLFYHHDGGGDSTKLTTGYNASGERWRRRDSGIPGSLSLISNANAIIRRHLYPWIAATSHHLLSTKVNHHSRNQWPRNHQLRSLGVSWVADHDYDVDKVSRSRLDIDIDTLATFSSYPRFQPQPAAPEYAEMTFLKHFWSHKSFLASADSSLPRNGSRYHPYLLEPISGPKSSTRIRRTGGSCVSWVAELIPEVSAIPRLLLSVDPPTRKPSLLLPLSYIFLTLSASAAQ
ncbi:hypothetical protein Moror_9543 [Moniliophthora roreri MCA 2997]|nr:hypothetical protein Moror_9543 [Moniliophthora roreri MCA 2997]